MQFVWLFILTIVTWPWNCSSIGDNNAIARRKLRVRAPSIPTNPMIWEFSPFEILSCLSYFYSFATNSIFHINLLNSFLSCEGNVFLLTKFYFNAECVCVYVCMFCLLYCGVACHIVYHKIYYSQNTDYNRISIKNISMIPLGFPFM